MQLSLESVSFLIVGVSGVFHSLDHVHDLVVFECLELTRIEVSGPGGVSVKQTSHLALILLILSMIVGWSRLSGQWSVRYNLW